MKKNLTFAALFLFSLVFAQSMPAIGYGEAASTFSGKEEDIPFSTARIFSKVIEKTGLDPNADVTKSFGESNPEEVDSIGKDLYLLIYNQTENEPQQQAYKNTAARYSLTEGQMVSLMYGDYTPLLQKTKSLTQEQAQEKVTEIQKAFAEEKDVLRLEANLKAAVEPTEIFANGDINDSGFDLVNDLNLIEELLFQQAQPISVGGNYNGGAAATEASVGTPNGVVAGGSLKASSSQAYTSPSLISSSLSQPGTGSKDKSLNVASSNKTVMKNESSGSTALKNFNPETCYGDVSTYSTAINQYLMEHPDESSSSQVLSQKGSLGSGVGKELSQNSEINGSSNREVTSANGSNDFLPAQVPASAPLKSAPSDDWKKQKSCDGIFCLSVEFVTKPVTSSFSDSDNCIACHMEHMNDTLKYLINHTLSPGKAPGNLGEGATCKKGLAASFSTVSMNVYAFPVPIKTPANDDLIYTTNADTAYNSLCNALSFLPTDMCNGNSSSASDSFDPSDNIIDRITKKELSSTSENSDSVKVAENIDRAVKGYTAERNKAAASLDASNRASEQLLFYQPLAQELDTMNFYFKGMSDILQSLHEKVASLPGGMACTDLKNKNECQ